MQTQGNYRLGMLILGVTAALVCCLLALAAAQPAQAAFPGNNGKIVFWSNRSADPGLYAVTPGGGTATKIPGTSGGDIDPAYSPDGTKITFIRGNQVWVMRADGTGAAQITSSSTAKTEPAWSNDGTKIAYVANSFDVDGQMDLEIWATNADGSGTPTNLTNNTFPDSQPAWSPDGTRIAFVSNRGDLEDTDRNVYVMNANGSGLASNLTPYTPGERPGDPPYQGHDDSPNWSPDGTKIAYVHTHEPNASGLPNIWVMDAGGDNKQNVQDNAGVSGVEPAWSPDGTRIAYVGTASGTTNRDIWAMDVTGANQRTLEAGGNAAHDINPDWQNDSVRPTVKKAGPTGKRVSPKANVTATFSEAMDKASVEAAGTFTLKKKGSAKAVSATVTYEPTTEKATLDPARKLKRRATYIATLSTAAKDAAGNALDQNASTAGNQSKSWRFKVK